MSDVQRPAGAPDGTTETLSHIRSEAQEWLEYFRESANPQTAAERWEYLDQAAVHIERLLGATETESQVRGGFPRSPRLSGCVRSER